MKRSFFAACLGVVGFALLGVSGTVRAQSWQPAAPMNAARYAHTATLLPTGEVLVTGGKQLFVGNNGGFEATLPSTELFDLAGRWRLGPPLAGPRRGHTATLLSNGDVLVVGGTSVPAAEIYSTRSGTWRAPTNLPNAAREFHTATLLRDGRVLIVGGSSVESRAEVYDPSDETWTLLPGTQYSAYLHTATLLPNGNVFLISGLSNLTSTLRFIEDLPDPPAPPDATTLVIDVSTWTTTAGPNLVTGRIGHSAVLTQNGEVLVLGGDIFGSVESIAAAGLPGGAFSQSPGETMEFSGAALLLPEGDIVLVGDSISGFDWGGATSSLVDSTTYQVTSFNGQSSGRVPSLVALPSGKALLCGGIQGAAVMDGIRTTTRECWILDPDYGWETTSWTPATQPLLRFRVSHTNSLLPSGDVLVVSDDESERVALVAGVPSTSSGGFPAHPRRNHTATLLPSENPHQSGDVLIAGGVGGSGHVLPVETYRDGSSQPWSIAGSLLVGRSGHTATLLPSGKILFAGGGTSSVEIYDPVTGTSAPTGSMAVSRTGHRAFLLDSGDVLVTGGYLGTLTELFSPTTGTWTPAADIVAARIGRSREAFSAARSR